MTRFRKALEKAASKAFPYTRTPPHKNGAVRTLSRSCHAKNATFERARISCIVPGMAAGFGLIGSLGDFPALKSATFRFYQLHQVTTHERVQNLTPVECGRCKKCNFPGSFAAGFRPAASRDPSSPKEIFAPGDSICDFYVPVSGRRTNGNDSPTSKQYPQASFPLNDRSAATGHRPFLRAGRRHRLERAGDASKSEPGVQEALEAACVSA